MALHSSTSLSCIDPRSSSSTFDFTPVRRKSKTFAAYTPLWPRPLLIFKIKVENENRGHDGATAASGAVAAIRRMKPDRHAGVSDVLPA
jgi:hypothetical protein